MTRANLARAAQALAAGMVVAVPTDTVYGLAVDPRHDGAAESLFALKRRPELLALPVLIADPEQLDELAVACARARLLASRYWPGPLTLVMERQTGIGFSLGGDASTIGLRCPGHKLVRELLRQTGPLAVTSANRHGDDPLQTAEAVRRYFGEAVPLVLDGGRCDGSPSTVVSLTAKAPQCLREGSIAFSEVVSLLEGT